MVAAAPSALSTPAGQGRSASRSASDRRGATQVSPDTAAETAPQECVPVGETAQLDGNAGIDNVFGGEISTTLDFVFPGFARSIVDTMNEGRGTPLVRVTGWNGQHDDPLVRVELRQAADGTTDAPSDVSFDGAELVRVLDASPASSPGWAGADRWYASEVTGAGSASVYVDEAAYFAGGTLVFRIADVLDVRYFYGTSEGFFRLRGTLFSIPFDDALTRCGPTIVGGRTSVDDLVAIAEHVGYCEGSTFHAELEEALRINADLRIDPTAEPDTACEAISVGIRFDTCALGQWIDTVPIAPLADPCP
jgi:hypothetical protein